MNHGQGNDHPLNRQIGFRVSDTVSPDVHARNQAQIQMYRNYIDEMERQNRIGLDRWYSEQERELQERVEAGRQAERMLSQLKNQRGSTPMASTSQAHAYISNQQSNIPSQQAAPPNNGMGYSSGYVPPTQEPSYVNRGTQGSYQGQPIQHNMAHSQAVQNSYGHAANSRGHYRGQNFGSSTAERHTRLTGHFPYYPPPTTNSVPPHASTSSYTYANYVPPISANSSAQSSRPSASKSPQPVNPARGNSASTSREPSQQVASEESDPVLFAQRLVDLCEKLKPEIQNEIVARLLPKIQANFRATSGRVPLDAHAESKLVAIMAQMKAKLINHSPTYVIQVAKHLQKPSPDPTKPNSPGHTVAGVVVREYLQSLSQVAESTSQLPTSSVPVTSTSNASLAGPSYTPNPVIAISEAGPSVPRATPIQPTSLRGSPSAQPQPTPSPTLPSPPPATSQPSQVDSTLTPVTPAKATLAQDIIRNLTKTAITKTAASTVFPLQSQGRKESVDDPRVKRKRADSSNSTAAADLPDKKPRISPIPPAAQSLALNKASSLAHAPIPSLSQDATPTTPPSSTVQLPFASPELIGEIKTAGVLEMEMATDIPGPMDHQPDVLHFDQLSHFPEPDHPTQDESNSHPASHASGPPSSGSDSSLGAKSVPAEKDPSPSPQPIPGPSKLPLFLPSDDEDEDGNALKSDPGFDMDSDHFILNPDLLPPGTPQSSPQARKTPQSHRMGLTKDNINIPSGSQVGKRISQTPMTPTRFRSPRRFMSHIELPPPPKRGKIKTSSSASNSEGEVETALDDVPNGTGRDQDKRTWTRHAGSRLQTSPCYWYGCTAELDSITKLVKHVILHTQETLETRTFRCQWGGCSDQFPTYTELLQHAKRHAAYPIFCPYEGCNATFDSSKVLVSHIRSSRQHRESPQLRPEACLLKPDLSRELPQLPDIIPMYQVVPRKISKPSMEPDHHFRMGAKVLANILCYVPLGRSRQTAPLRSVRQVPTNIGVLENVLREDPQKAKQFIQERVEEQNLRSKTSTGPKLCDDIPSEWVTRLVIEGRIVFEDPNAPELVLSDDESSHHGAETGDANLIDGTSHPHNDANAGASGEAVRKETPSREPDHSQQPGSESGSGG